MEGGGEGWCDLGTSGIVGATGRHVDGVVGGWSSADLRSWVGSPWRIQGRRSVGAVMWTGLWVDGPRRT